MTATTGTVSDAIGARLDFDVINQRAKDLGITKVALAEAVGVDPSTIWRWAQGMKPTLEVALKLGDALQLTVDEMTGKKQMTGNPTPSAPSGPSGPSSPSRPKAGETHA